MNSYSKTGKVVHNATTLKRTVMYEYKSVAKIQQTRPAVWFSSSNNAVRVYVLCSGGELAMSVLVRGKKNTKILSKRRTFMEHFWNFSKNSLKSRYSGWADIII